MNNKLEKEVNWGFYQVVDRIVKEFEVKRKEANVIAQIAFDEGITLNDAYVAWLSR